MIIKELRYKITALQNYRKKVRNQTPPQSQGQNAPTPSAPRHLANRQKEHSTARERHHPPNLPPPPPRSVAPHPLGQPCALSGAQLREHVAPLPRHPWALRPLPPLAP
nr:MAG TPA_asm: hypothetical protein [Caudoviricetes sp.]